MRELERALARHVKRELSDEQNEMLDAVRRDRLPLRRKVLADPEDHVERYANAATATLSDAALGGPELLPEPRAAAPEGPGSADWRGTWRPSWRPSWSRRCAAASRRASPRPPRADDDRDLSETVRADYREWRRQRVDPLVDPRRHHGDEPGVLGGLEPGHDGALARGRRRARRAPTATATPRPPACRPGHAFPSAHTAPPIHDGCRCLLVVDAR